MSHSLEVEILAESAKVLKLLDAENLNKARDVLERFDTYLQAQGKVPDINVDTLWIQTRIAVLNPDNKTYLQDVKEQLNSLVFKFSSKR